ncbi:tetratricopeptide repeat-containing sulfotransferase family protein [Dokdonella sp.]|uniref:tetratricopeptide repeat-containing sulfotransferase family protein n=1 Tax=Dokdonella sp. TaxID=2291710 RepID=UPI003C46FCC2
MSTADLTAPLLRLEPLLATMNVSGIAELFQRLRSGTASEQEWIGSAEPLLRADPLSASVLLQAATDHHPECAQLHYLLGNARRMCAEKPEAETSLRRAIALDPAHANASLSLAYLLREQARMRSLAEVMLALWRHESRSLDSDRRTLGFLCECERFAEAETLVEPMLASHPDEPSLLRRAGEIALVLGRFEDARNFLRKALAIDPAQASAWLRLAHTHRFAAQDDPDLVFLREGAARKDLAEDADTAIGFALGKALDDLGETGEATDVLRRTNSRWHDNHPWDANAFEEFVQARLAAPVLTAVPHAQDGVPIFIAGLPRSGTTLAASLLSRGEGIRNRGELNWISALASRLGDNPTAEMLAGAGRYFMMQLQQDDAPARYYIDKNPLNFRHLDLIGAMLPQARIIHCRRDLRDTALSIWSQHFAHGDMAWSYAFDDIARFVNGYQRLMSRWQTVMPDRIFELDYEALVSDTDSTLERLRQFLGLDPSAISQGSPGRPDEVIATASVWQARQKIHSRSVDRWQRYLEYLPELDNSAFG